jgi:hypothetical protein
VRMERALMAFQIASSPHRSNSRCNRSAIFLVFHTVILTVSLDAVKTLVIRSTAEEAMIARRNALKETAGKLPAFEDEVGMRDFIEVGPFTSYAMFTYTHVSSYRIPNSSVIRLRN